MDQTQLEISDCAGEAQQLLSGPGPLAFFLWGNPDGRPKLGESSSDKIIVPLYFITEVYGS
jgi:hypothetical protein